MGFVSKQTTRRSFTATCLLLCFVGLPANAQETPTNEGNPTESIPGEGALLERMEDEAAEEPEAQAQIRKALRGLADENEQQKAGGDPLLDDVLQMIRRRGSILDGTALDPELSEPAEPAVTEPAANGPSVRSHGPTAPFRTAESLLRSARLLEALPDQDATRQQLIRRMRSEASRCLRQALLPSPTAPPETR